MIPLNGKVIKSTIKKLDDDAIIRLNTNSNLPRALRKNEAFLVRDGSIPEGFLGYITFSDAPLSELDDLPVIQLGDEMSYLSDGDVLRISSNLTKVRVLYRRTSPHNTFLLTERCNHYCVMCSQPPKNVDDSQLIDELRKVIPLISRDTKEIGFSGGEPTLLGSDFVGLVRMMESFLPETSLHVLSNGTLFSNREFAESLAKIRHHDLMIGVPLYSDVPEIHDYIVQNVDAWDETVRGLINLGRARVPIEIRVVIQSANHNRLFHLADFICRNFPFVAQVSFMGLEMVGFARANIEQIWIEPDEYAEELDNAIQKLDSTGIRSSVYNLQRCLMPESIWPFMVRSISDWKNEFLSECDGCVERANCGGFFSSFIYKKPKNIQPITP